MKNKYNHVLAALLFAAPVAAFAEDSGVTSESQVTRRAVVQSAADETEERLRQATMYAELVRELHSAVKDAASAPVAVEGISSVGPALVPAPPVTVSFPRELAGVPGAAASAM